MPLTAAIVSAATGIPVSPTGASGVCERAAEQDRAVRGDARRHVGETAYAVLAAYDPDASGTPEADTEGDRGTRFLYALAGLALARVMPTASLRAIANGGFKTTVGTEGAREDLIRPGEASRAAAAIRQTALGDLDTLTAEIAADSITEDVNPSDVWYA